MKIKCKVCRKETEIDELEYTPGDKIVVECQRCGNEMEAIIPSKEDEPTGKPKVKVVDNDLKSVWYGAANTSPSDTSKTDQCQQTKTRLTTHPTHSTVTSRHQQNQETTTPTTLAANINLPHDTHSSSGKVILFVILGFSVIAGTIIWLVAEKSGGAPAHHEDNVYAVVEEAAVIEDNQGTDEYTDSHYEPVDTVVAEAEDTIEAEEGQTYDAAFFHSGHGYRTTSSGLKYINIVEGTGPSPTANSTVTVHYTGSLTDGTVFDSSIARGEPASFPLQAVIKGWTEGLQLMKTGETTIFYIPSHLAYGETGTPGGPIGPNEDLIFTVVLLGVND